MALIDKPKSILSLLGLPEQSSVMNKPAENSLVWLSQLLPQGVEDAIPFDPSMGVGGPLIAQFKGQGAIPKATKVTDLVKKGYSTAESNLRNVVEHWRNFMETMRGAETPSEILNPDRLRFSNDKVQAWLFDLPPGLTCGKACKTAGCLEKCYAMKAQNAYPDVPDWRAGNLYLSKYEPDLLKQYLLQQLEDPKTYKKSDMVRLHSAGDTYSKEYADMLADVVGNAPDYSFYTYTKQPEERFENLLKQKNFNLVRSILPGGERNFGPLEEMEKLAEKYGDLITAGKKICPATVAPNAGIKCGRDCWACLQTPYMLFKEH